MQITAVSDLAGKDGPGDHGRRAQAAGSAARAARRRAGQRRRDGQQDDGARRPLALQPADAARPATTRASASGRSSCRRSSLPQRDFRSLLKLAEFAMAQQDIRYYLNGMLLVVDKGTLQAVATDGHRLSWASIAIDGDYTRAGSDPAAQDGARAVEAARRQRRRRVTIDILANQARFRFGNVELVSKVVDGKFPDYNRVIPDRPRQEHRARARDAAVGAAARGDPVEREIPRRAPRAGRRSAEDHLHEQRAGRGRGGARRRLQRRRARHRLQHHLPARRAVEPRRPTRCTSRSATPTRARW